ncbi:XRE family transcriptional regulator [Aerococcus urinae]|uniref:XRE family transcriptional regulator n=1 Tax=Aerococcus mictus TaxID=2976810 RepID=A0A1E9PHT1_9LACT|nr:MULTISPECIES: XRE family transcriptional regulator [Aerococcus]KAA9291238.1 LexA family transcriptional regulator [Aerococcus mictus]MBU5611160.1 XRE family transcriptional regulator [Aerococcus urinae]MCY3064931.1 XRE family transcriptional regulator [Aerococcus mictus]MCY3077346.1 XRE family transcriptional regulator [Aerococcus mictus]MCY3081445.1 XRE family transcriptional regulator [Aerococcus mictus]
MHLGEIIKKYRTQNNMSMDSFSKRSGISKAYISVLEKNKDPRNGKKVTPSIPIIKKAAEGMGVMFDDLFNQLDNEDTVSFKQSSSTTLDSVTETTSKLIERRQQKVLHYAENQLEQQNTVNEENETYTLRKRPSAAGSAIYVDDDEYNYEVVSASVVPKGADELVEITGDSMQPLIQKGDEVYIRHQPTVENGEVAIVRIADEGVTCKRVYTNEDGIILRSENPKYDDMHLEANQVTILGKVIL